MKKIKLCLALVLCTGIITTSNVHAQKQHVATPTQAVMPTQTVVSFIPITAKDMKEMLVLNSTPVDPKSIPSQPRQKNEDFIDWLIKVLF